MLIRWAKRQIVTGGLQGCLKAWRFVFSVAPGTTTYKRLGGTGRCRNKICLPWFLDDALSRLMNTPLFCSSSSAHLSNNTIPLLMTKKKKKKKHKRGVHTWPFWRTVPHIWKQSESKEKWLNSLQSAERAGDELSVYKARSTKYAKKGGEKKTAYD